MTKAKYGYSPLHYINEVSMDEIIKKVITEKIQETLKQQIYLEERENGFSFYIDRAHLIFENSNGVWIAHFHKTDYRKENDEWMTIERDISIDEYELTSTERKVRLQKIVDYLNSANFEDAKKEFLTRVDCETLVLRNNKISLNEVKATVIGTSYHSESTFISHRDNLLEGLFPDYQNISAIKHDADEELEYLYHDLISCNSAFEYCYIHDLEIFNLLLPSYKGFQEACVDKIIEDYHDLFNINKPFYALDDDKVKKLLTKMKHKCPVPAITNEEGEVPYVCFYMIEGISKIPLLLLIAVLKNVLGFHTFNDVVYYLNYQSFFWDNGEKIMFCIYLFTGAKQMTRFTGFKARKIDPYNQGFEDFENRDFTLPSHLEIFKK